MGTEVTPVGLPWKKSYPSRLAMEKKLPQSACHGKKITPVGLPWKKSYPSRLAMEKKLPQSACHGKKITPVGLPWKKNYPSLIPIEKTIITPVESQVFVKNSLFAQMTQSSFLKFFKNFPTRYRSLSQSTPPGAEDPVSSRILHARSLTADAGPVIDFS